jgi:hypothetical protein
MSSCVCTYDKLPWPKSEVHYAMHSHNLHADTEDPSKNLHILFPCPLFQILCMRSSSNFTACKNSQNWTTTKYGGENTWLRDIHTQNTEQICFNYFSPSFTKQVAIFAPGSIWAWQEVMISEVKNVLRVLRIQNPQFWPDNVGTSITQSYFKSCKMIFLQLQINH